MASDSPDDLSPATRLVTGGRRREWLGGMVNVPVARTSTVLFEDVAAMALPVLSHRVVLNFQAEAEGISFGAWVRREVARGLKRAPKKKR
mgnify:CR=1 FL=1